MPRKAQTIILEITKNDIVTAKCGNRRQCVIAHAVDRQLQLGGLGYIKIEGNDAAYTQAGFRHLLRLPRTALVMLRDFDEIGASQGLETAREVMFSRCPIKYRLREVNVTKIPPPASRERKDQINARRNRIASEEHAQGIVRPKRKRYAGT
jgi:hypothetical protein